MSPTKNKKSRIIEAALDVFAEKGFRAATITDLARAAGLGEATIYNHFKNKEEILLSCPLFHIGAKQTNRQILNSLQKKLLI